MPGGRPPGGLRHRTTFGLAPLGIAAIAFDTLGEMNEQSDSAARLYLVIEATTAATAHLAAALEAAPVACVLISSPPGLPLEAGTVRPLVERIQRNDSAALILDDAALARTLEADGIHLSPSPDCLTRYKDARELLGSRFIVGAHAGKSRHAAMELGEAAADYVAFGVPTAVSDRTAAEARRLDLVSWWAEIFEIPCVAMDVATPQTAAELARAQADFIAVSLPGETAPDAAAALVRAIHDAIVDAPRSPIP
jgi:thiamine-phosphate pyrophosphorylase